MIVNQTLLMRAGPLTFRRGTVLSNEYIHLLWGDDVMLSLGSKYTIDALKSVCEAIMAGEPYGSGILDYEMHHDTAKDKDGNLITVKRWVVWYRGDVVGIIEGASTAKLILTMLEKRDGSTRQTPA
jgi:hypothetical protein